VADATVVVVNWNGNKVLPICLEALSRQTWKSFRVVVVDNGSTDGSAECVTKHNREIELVRLPSNMGFCRANNIALRRIATPYVALLNNDAFPGPQWLEALVNSLERHPEAGFAASKLLFYDARGFIDRAGDGYTKAGVGYLRGRWESCSEHGEEEMVFGASAAAALYRTEMLHHVGLFDEDFFLLHEDVDLSFRAQLMGFRCVYVPDAVAYHGVSSSIMRDSPTSVYYGQRNLEWVYLKNMPSSLLLRTSLLHMVYTMFAFAFFLRLGRGRDFIRAKRDAFFAVPVILRKRKEIQAHRAVDDRYIFALLEKERLMERKTSRRRRNQAPYRTPSFHAEKRVNPGPRRKV
jgi:GT2 family glycosyltransferase